MPDAAFLRKFFHKEGRLLESQVIWLLEEGARRMREEDNVLAVEAPVTCTFRLESWADFDPPYN